MRTWTRHPIGRWWIWWKYFLSIPPLSLEEIITLFSIAGDLQISQVVDPLVTARFALPNWILETYGTPF